MLLDAIRLRRVTAKDKLQPASFFYDARALMLYLWLPDSADPNKYKVEVAVRPVLLNIRGNFVIVRGIQMRHASTLALGPGPGCGIQGTIPDLENCTITWTDWVGVIFSGSRNSLVVCRRLYGQLRD